MIKARVLLPLNLRTGTPEVLSHNNTGDKYFNPGEVVEISEAVIGEKYQDSNVWYKLADGGFVWSGGVVDSDTINYSFRHSLCPQWMRNLQIPEIWEYTKGKGVGIGVIDTGIYLQTKNISFNKSNFYLFEGGTSLQDSFGHGTHCAGLIGSKNINGVYVGVAPESDLYICKFSETGSLTDAEAIRYAEAIKWCATNPDIHIISISWGGRMRNLEIRAQVENAIKSAAAKNKIILCSIGDASRDNDNSKRYPACFEDTIGIGCIPVEGKLYSYLNEHLLTVVDGYEIMSFSHENDVLVPMSGTSQSNAIVAGIVALILSKLDLRYSSLSIKQILVDLSSTQTFLGKQLLCLDGEKLLNFFKN